MAYDPNDAADVAALKSELETDPVSMGYNLGKAKNIAKIINDVDSNTAPATVQRGWPDIQIQEFMDDGIIDETEHTGLTDLQKGKVMAALGYAPETPISEGIRLLFRNSYGNNSTTYGTNLTGLRTVDGSRADVLFGYGSNISVSDIAAALES